MKKIFVFAVSLFSISGVYAESAKLSKANVIKKYEKGILDEPTTRQITKDSILESPDLAKSLLDISGFSMSRKGGGGSEVSYRSGLSGRLPIFTDGSEIHGGCGGRMDTAITYIAPQNYRSIKIIKGPQDVRYGALVNGGLFFDREILRLDKTIYGADLNLLYGSFNQSEISGEVIAGGELGNIQVNGGFYKSDDYKDGNGNKVHSQYERKQGSFWGTFTPNATMAISFGADFGDGEAAYADRAMDGVQFERESYNLSLEKRIDKHNINIQGYYHKINHIMDNYSLRPVKAGDMYRLSNPKREIIGARAEAEMHFDRFNLYAGGSYKEDTHSSKMATSNISGDDANTKANNASFNKNALVSTASIFTQGEYLSIDDGVFGGIRLDRVEIDKYSNGSISDTKNDTPLSAFLRYEKYYNDLSLYAGIGRAERVADFWEFQKVGGMDLNTEKNHQIDIGLVYDNTMFNGSSNLFVSKVDDYIVLKYGTATSAFNTDALLMGGEIEGEVLIDNFYKIGAGVSYVYGKNLKNTNGLKDGDPLPQISPLTFKATLGLEQQNWFATMNFYANASQHRYKEGYGNVVGKDLGFSDSFWTLGINGGYKYKNYEFLVAVIKTRFKSKFFSFKSK